MFKMYKCVTIIDMDVLVVGQHGLRTAAKFASDGKFYEARAGAIISHNLLKRSGFDFIATYLYISLEILIDFRLYIIVKVVRPATMKL